MFEEEDITQFLVESNHSTTPAALTYPFTTLSADLANRIRYTGREKNGIEIEDSFEATLWDLDGNVITETQKYFRAPRLSDFGQLERIRILKNAYLHHRGMMLRTIRRIIRLYTHPDQSDIHLFVQDEIASCVKEFDLLEELAKLLFEEIKNPLANDFLDEIYIYNFEKAFELEAAKEAVQNPITNTDILKECEKSKTEIIDMMKGFVERQEKLKLPNIIQRLIDEGQLKQEPDEKTGKYITFTTIYNFFDWCFMHGYADKINAAFVAEYIKTNCSLETLKKYERDVRDIVDEKRKSHRKH